MVTAGDKDDIAPLVLGQGRTFMVFVTDPAKESVVADQLKSACSLALMRGWFPGSNQAPTMVGQGVLPHCVPSTNVSGAVAREVAAHTEANMDSDDGCESDEADDLVAHRSVAGKLAGMQGIEIKVRDSTSPSIRL